MRAAGAPLCGIVQAELVFFDQRGWGMVEPAGQSRQVFVSYASPDEDRATVVCMQLESLGISCWKAPRDIRPGMRYAEAILEGINDAAVFLLLYSAAAERSTHVANEIEEAASKDKAIVVVRTDHADPGANRSVSLFLRSHQWFDASSGPISSHTSHLATDIRGLLDRTSQMHAAAIEQHPDLSDAVPSTDRRLAPAPKRRRTSGALSIGIDVGATKIRACVIDLSEPDAYSPVATEVKLLDESASNPRTVMEEVRTIARRMATEHVGDSPLAGVGVAVPGQVDCRVGTLKFGPNLFGARNLPFKTHLQGVFPRVPIRVDNDIRCATRAELHLGVGQQFDSFSWIFVGDGVGSGTVIDRRVHFGHNFCAGEIGHMKIAQAGAPCACGQSGCLETFVKVSAIVARAQAKAIEWESRGKETKLGAGNALSPQGIVEAIEGGDEAAMEVAADVGQSLGLGIANYLNLVNPAAVVLGGGLMTGFFFHMIDAISAAVQRNSLPEVANTPIVQSAHSDDGIATGAALMFHENDGWPFA